MTCRDRAEPKKVPPIPERHGRMLRPTLCVLALAAGAHGAPVKRESKEASAKRPAWYVRASAGKFERIKGMATYLHMNDKAPPHLKAHAERIHRMDVTQVGAQVMKASDDEDDLCDLIIE